MRVPALCRDCGQATSVEVGQPYECPACASKRRVLEALEKFLERQPSPGDEH